MARHFVRIRGVMRSGTNLVAWMLRHNFQDTVPLSMILGWKHGPLFQDARALDLETYFDPRWLDLVRTIRDTRPDVWQRLAGSDLLRDGAAAFERGEVSTVLCTRAPADWFTSCVRAVHENPGLLMHRVTPRDAAAHWNETHADWLRDLPPRTALVDADRLRHDPENVLQAIATRLPDLVRTPDTRAVDTHLFPGSEDELWPILGMPVPRREPQGPSCLEPVDPDVMDRFLALLDPGILTSLGYAARIPEIGAATRQSEESL